MLTTLGQVTTDIKANNYPAAVSKLQDLRTRVDGCGVAPDASDWIIDCATQSTIRASLDQIISKLGG
jgi:hypothetical protein